MILKLLEDKGYQAISFDSGYAYTDFREVDRYFSPHRNIIKLNSFEGMLLNASMARIFIDKGLITSPYSYANHRDTVVYALDHLADTALIAGPKFVFAHIMAPHPPFILDENGQAVQSEQPYHLTFQGTREEYISGYAKEITYIDQELIAALDSILQLSSIAPVIILQADHGPGAYLNWDKYDEGCVQERMAILNAYYLPGINNNDLSIPSPIMAKRGP